MSEENKSIGKKRLAQAVQDAAIESISEDINEICISIEKITNELPIHVRKELSILKEDIESLNESLNVVPKQFDTVFSKKMNQILDVLKETDAHTQTLRTTIQEDNQVQITKQAEKLASIFNRNLNEHSLISTWTLFLYGATCSIIGTAFGGLFAAILVWIVFPKIF
jgi:hypothetical protein